ncbi:MAG: hypothetical protein J0I24_04020 [Thiomonas arsenitoxydans]|jgi:hypothetical protein|uniref:Uncharacterized protein n=1 Tax=Thiomonas arsenitoxydans (strain DSM 22701 / CIP 110005 / 3As) TaxID=426114 RepID=A0A8I1SWC4_THIA3|nr:MULTISPECIES: hypothetical protein [Thiomonas]MBN8743454.1 hypothetical protein [Thiomonas arsenitoxydans]
MDAADLFGQIPVTLEDVSLWVAAVAPHVISSRLRLEHYIKMWDVATKVATAKASGKFHEVSASADAGTAQKALDLLQSRAAAETTSV